MTRGRTRIYREMTRVIGDFIAVMYFYFLVVVAASSTHADHYSGAHTRDARQRGQTWLAAKTGARDTVNLSASLSQSSVDLFPFVSISEGIAPRGSAVPQVYGTGMGGRWKL